MHRPVLRPGQAEALYAQHAKMKSTPEKSDEHNYLMRLLMGGGRRSYAGSVKAARSNEENTARQARAEAKRFTRQQRNLILAAKGAFVSLDVYLSRAARKRDVEQYQERIRAKKSDARLTIERAMASHA